MSIQWYNNVNLVRIKRTLEQVCPLGEAIGSHSALRGTSKDTERETEKNQSFESERMCIDLLFTNDVHIHYHI